MKRSSAIIVCSASLVCMMMAGAVFLYWHAQELYPPSSQPITQASEVPEVQITPNGGEKVSRDGPHVSVTSRMSAIEEARRAVSKGLDSVKDLLLRLPPGTDFDAAISLLSKELAREGPNGLTWVISNSPTLGNHQTYQLVTDVSHFWSLKDPEAAFSWLATSPQLSENLRSAALMSAAPNLFSQKGAERALALINADTPNELRQQILMDDLVLRNWVYANHTSLMGYLTEIQSPSQGTIRKIGEAIASDPKFESRIMDYLELNPAVSAPYLEFAFQKAVGMDFNKTLSMLKLFPTGTLRDSIIVKIWPQIYGADIEAARVWIDSITDDTIKRQATLDFERYKTRG